MSFSTVFMRARNTRTWGRAGVYRRGRPARSVVSGKKAVVL